MKIRLDLSFEDVYEIIKYGREQIDINPGISQVFRFSFSAFMRQLLEYYDELHPQSAPQPEEVRDTQAETEGEIVEEKLAEVALTVDAKEWMLDSIEKAEAKPTLQYACKNCRSVLFNNLDIKEHEQGGGNASFGWGKREYVRFLFMFWRRAGEGWLPRV